MESIKVMFNVYQKDGTDTHYDRNFKTLSHFITHIKLMDDSYKIEIREDNHTLICDCYAYMGILRGVKNGKI